jgi:hypothetical protein
VDLKHALMMFASLVILLQASSAQTIHATQAANASQGNVIPKPRLVPHVRVTLKEVIVKANSVH